MHAFCPLSPCSLFAKVTVPPLVWGLRGRQGWRTQRSSTALSALHSPWWLIYTSLHLPVPPLFTMHSAVCDVGGQSWMLRIWAHQYTRHLLFFCNVLNINTTCSLRNDKEQYPSCRDGDSQRARVGYFCRKLWGMYDESYIFPTHKMARVCLGLHVTISSCLFFCFPLNVMTLKLPETKCVYACVIHTKEIAFILILKCVLLPICVFSWASWLSDHRQMTDVSPSHWVASTAK